MKSLAPLCNLLLMIMVSIWTVLLWDPALLALLLALELGLLAVAGQHQRLCQPPQPPELSLRPELPPPALPDFRSNPPTSSPCQQCTEIGTARVAAMAAFWLSSAASSSALPSAERVGAFVF